jgi:alanyl-tRNA synthetase
MLDKAQLRSDFSRNPGKYYTTETFKKEGFERKRCRECGKYFWTTDNARELCGDPSHEPYSFIKDNAREVNYLDFWKRFSKFFKKERHSIIGSYPVVSRWRQDLYFTIAGIQDFQRIENGRISFEYPSNPLMVPQICMRFNDISNVGITGRHFTSFMMANQTAFNYPKEGYWRDRTIGINFKFLTDVLGIKKDDLTYIEDVWAMGDFSEFGPSLEFFSKGLELGNNVFTQFEYSNDSIKELKGKVVDVGWGFERLLWYYSGAQTAYDSAFRKELEYIYSNTGIKHDARAYAKIARGFGQIDTTELKGVDEFEKRLLGKVGMSESDYTDLIKPMQAAYAIADHTRTLLFAISDGALPSNVGGGYNLRIALRRVFDLMGEYGLDIDLMKLMEMHSNELVGIYSHIKESTDEMSEIIEVERKRYENTKAAALKIVSSVIEGHEPLTPERVRTLYESNGITPDFIKSVADSRKVKIEIPEYTYVSLVKGDFTEKRKEAKLHGIDIDGIPSTVKLFYKNAQESNSRILLASGNMVVLDKTPFYAESGGQEADYGTINGIQVKDVQSVNGVIVHTLAKPIGSKKGQAARCIVDKERRSRLMAHHTATHLVSAAARSVLGKHAWQEGAKKSYDKAHIDIAHYEKLSDAQIGAIEGKANSYIMNGIKVTVNEMDRKKAEARFGFSIYQGHGVPSGKLRIVQVRDLSGNLIDAEACGGLHLEGKESEIGLIKITSSSRIHDGINRIEFVAGPAALEHLNAVEQSIDRLARLTGVDRDKLEPGLSARLKELEMYRSEYEAMKERLGGYIVKELEGAQERTLSRELDCDREMLRKIATKFADSRKDSTVLLYNKALDAVAISGSDSKEDALEFARERAKMIGRDFKGGGSKRIAEGKLV